MLSFLRRLFRFKFRRSSEPLWLTVPIDLVEPPIIVIVDRVRVTATFRPGTWPLTEKSRQNFAEMLVKQCRDGAFVVPKDCELLITAES